MRRTGWCEAGILVMLAMGAIFSACGKQQADVILTVSAASDLTYAFAEVGRLFEQQTGLKVVLNFGSTGQLAQQIESGAPVDVFAAANASFIRDLARQGLIRNDTIEIYARGRLILWMRSDAPGAIRQLKDLLRPEVHRIAMANPDHAPYGMAAREALQSAHLWEMIQPKLILGENVRQALQYAETGNVDASLISLSLISGREGSQDTPAGRWIPVPEELYTPLDQALAVLKSTRHEPEARAFARFVHSPSAGAVMQKYGFLLPGEAR